MQTLRKMQNSVCQFLTQSINQVRCTSSSQPAEFISSNLHNGVGRYVCQLQRITFKFCKEYAGSRGIRDFIEHDLVDFAKSNPGIVVYLQPRRHRRPKLHAEYLNGSVQSMDVHMYSRDRLKRWLEFMRARKGDTIVRLLKKQKTVTPSIQGVWNPFTNKNAQLAIDTFPSEKFSRPVTIEKSTSELILELNKVSNPDLRK